MAESGLLNKPAEKVSDILKDPAKDILGQFSTWAKESEDARSVKEGRWVKNIRLLKGIWSADEMTKSKVRGRSKLYFRKIWATMWRLLASMYQAFLKDPDTGTFSVEGRGPEDVAPKAKVLQFATDYRLDKMFGEQNLFLEHIWGLQNILHMGIGGAKIWWQYRDGYDRPMFKTYPNEQLFLDHSASCEYDMRYVGFRNYMTKEQMKAEGYDNIEKAVPSAPPSSSLRAVRFADSSDPYGTGQEHHYPSPEQNNGGKKESFSPTIYIVDEWFWRGSDGKIRMAVANSSNCVLKKEKASPYGKGFPLVYGTCLTEANKLIGEGFPEPLEGPQESINHLINIRKDNVHLALNKHKYVNRFANVDLQSLANNRAGGMTMMDDVVAGVRTEETQDVTQSSYMEANSDESMMQEMSGVTSAKEGTLKNEKATTAQINLSESNAKIELFIAVVANTWFRSFYRKLVQYIQMFETDETVLRVANERLQREAPHMVGDYPIYDLGDFDADIKIKVGVSAPVKQTRIQNGMMAMQQAVAANQATMMLLQSGAIKPSEKIKFFDLTKFMDSILPDMGYKDVQNFVFEVQGLPPGMAQQGQGGGKGVAPSAAPEQLQAMMGQMGGNQGVI